ncbi:MAG: hydrogenase expression/formation protein HypE [Planctomycetota bacterium]
MSFGACPIPITDYPYVTLAHGGGGRLSRQLVDRMFRASFENEWTREQHDGAVLGASDGRPVFTTDSFVVSPIEFPGGDIGKLAVCGTVNDLAMCGAVPRYLSCALVIEEGLEMEALWRVVSSMGETARDAGVEIVTGDTKVVARGQADRIFVNTSGIGFVESDHAVRPASIAPGDALIVSGDVGRHGVAVMATRDGLSFESAIESDCAPLHRQTRALIERGIDVHGLRDLTRGGLATACVELARDGLLFSLDESTIPVREDVRGACEIFGLDPLYVANEGRFLAIVPEAQADEALSILASTGPDDTSPQQIGTVSESARGTVLLSSISGSERPLDMLSGEQLPRIC